MVLTYAAGETTSKVDSAHAERRSSSASATLRKPPPRVPLEPKLLPEVGRMPALARPLSPSGA